MKMQTKSRFSEIANLVLPRGKEFEDDVLEVGKVSVDVEKGSVIADWV